MYSVMFTLTLKKTVPDQSEPHLGPHVPSGSGFVLVNWPWAQFGEITLHKQAQRAAQCPVLV